MIAAEFGVGLPRSITQFYRGGGTVPNTPANAGVPTSGSISLTNFYGATAYTPVGANWSGNPNGTVLLNEPAPPNTGVTSGTVTVSGTGGNGGYTYSWTHLSGDASISINSPSSSATSFSATVSKNTNKTATKRCTVSDGSSSTTVDVSVTLTYNSNA